MTVVEQEADTLEDFTSNPHRFIDKLRTAREPIRLTVNGQDDLVLIDAKTYREYLDRYESAIILEALNESVRDIEAGRVYPARETLEELARKHNLPQIKDN